MTPQVKLDSWVMAGWHKCQLSGSLYLKPLHNYKITREYFYFRPPWKQIKAVPLCHSGLLAPCPQSLLEF